MQDKELSGPHIAGNIFKYIFVTEKFPILIWILTEFCCFWGGPISNKSALVGVMACRQLDPGKLNPGKLINQITMIFIEENVFKNAASSFVFTSIC